MALRCFQRSNNACKTDQEVENFFDKFKINLEYHDDDKFTKDWFYYLKLYGNTKKTSQNHVAFDMNIT